MLRWIFTRTLRDGRRGLLFWTGGILLLVGLTIVSFPAVRDLPQLDEILEGLPEAMRAFLGDIEDLTSPAGYLNSQLFSLLVPIMLLIYAINAGASAIAGEEERGTLDLLLANPVSRWRVVAEKTLALLIGTAILSLVFYVSILAMAPVVELQVGAGELAVASGANFLYAVLFGMLALTLGAATGSRGLALGITAALALLTYLVHTLGEFVTEVEPFQVLSPFYYAYGVNPLRNGLDGLEIAALAVPSLVLLVVAILLFRQRDLSV